MSERKPNECYGCLHFHWEHDVFPCSTCRFCDGSSTPSHWAEQPNASQMQMMSRDNRELRVDLAAAKAELAERDKVIGELRELAKLAVYLHSAHAWEEIKVIEHVALITEMRAKAAALGVSGEGSELKPGPGITDPEVLKVAFDNIKHLIPEDGEEAEG